MTGTITLACHHEMPDGTPCEADVEVTLGYEPDDPNYGADADGNRGIYVHGGFYVECIADRCEAGHEFTAEEAQELCRRADQAAQDYEPEDTRDYEPDDDDRWERSYWRNW